MSRINGKEVKGEAINSDSLLDKKKKKRRHPAEDLVNGDAAVLEENEVEIIDNNTPLTRKKKRRHPVEEAEDPVNGDAPILEDNEVEVIDNDPLSIRKKKRRHHEEDSIDLNPYNIQSEGLHVVAVMDHFRLKEDQNPHFVEHIFKEKQKIYSFKNAEAPDMTFVGKEKLEQDDNYDYCLAIYNRTTKELEYKPVSMVNFSGHHKVDPEMLSDTPSRKKINYNADYSLDKESFANRRKQLTSQFGSEQKIKLLEAHMRRNINEETLTTLAKSTFDSKHVVPKSEEIDSKAFAVAESSVLPTANRSAKNETEVYSLELFYSEFRLQHYGPQAQEFFKKYNEPSKLTQIGIQKIIIGAARKVMRSQDDEMQCYVALKLMIMSAIIENISAYNRYKLRRNISYAELLEFDFPPDMLLEVKEEFFKESINSQQRFGFSIIERDRLIAWFLCLFLILNDFKCPISPLANQLNLTETQITRTLGALGCNISTATEKEALSLQTTRMAYLTAAPREKFKRGRKSGA